MSPIAFAAAPLPSLRTHRKRRRPSLQCCATSTTSHILTPDGASLLRRETTPPSPLATAVFLHDFMTDHRLFHPLTSVLQRLRPSHRSVAYDLRGFGKSDNPTQPYSAFDDLQAAALPAAHALDLVAVGFGGPIALEFALARPEAVRSVCCIASGLPGHRWHPKDMLDITEARVSATRQMLMKIRESEEDAPSAELVQWKQAFIRASQAWTDVLKGDREVAKGVLQMAKDYRGFHFFSEEVVEPNPWGDVPLKDRLVGVGVPVCVMVGERDTPDFQEIADEIWEGVPHAWGDGVIKVPECGHFAVVEQHRAVAQRIAQFWGSLEDQRAGVEATAAEPEQKQT